MDLAKPSLVRRALAVVVLAVVAVVAFRMVLGALTAVFWIAALVALVIAALWAMSTLRSAKRGLENRRADRVDPGSAAALPVAAPEDRVEAHLAQLKQQLRDQGRL